MQGEILEAARSNAKWGGARRRKMARLELTLAWDT